MRSIFRLFEDVEALHAEGISVQMARVAPLFAAPEASGPLLARAESLVAQRSRLYETISPVRRLAIRLAARSTPIATQLARSNAVLRNQLPKQFAPELANLRPGPRDETIEALDAVTSWEAWDRLRTGQHLDAGAAARIPTATVLALLG